MFSAFKLSVYFKYLLSFLYGFEVLQPKEGYQRYPISTRTSNSESSVKYHIDKENISLICSISREREETLAYLFSEC